MLGLKMPTDPRWVNIAERNLEEVLIDHAFCEQKAASNAISMIVQYPFYSDLVEEMSAVAIEEMQHFDMVHQKLLERGYKLTFERKDPYVGDLVKFLKSFSGSKDFHFVNQMLFAAIIEARSCERFKILSTELEDEDLRAFYKGLMESEARHYMTFIRFAKKYGGNVNVDEQWQKFLDFEASLMEKYGTSETIHG